MFITQVYRSQFPRCCHCLGNLSSMLFSLCHTYIQPPFKALGAKNKQTKKILIRAQTPSCSPSFRTPWEKNTSHYSMGQQNVSLTS